MVGFFSGGVGLEGFLEWSAQEEGLSCAVATTQELRKKYDVAEGSVVMFKKVRSATLEMSRVLSCASSQIVAIWQVVSLLLFMLAIVVFKSLTASVNLFGI